MFSCNRNKQSFTTTLIIKLQSELNSHESIGNFEPINVKMMREKNSVNLLLDPYPRMGTTLNYAYLLPSLMICL